MDNAYINRALGEKYVSLVVMIFEVLSVALYFVSPYLAFLPILLIASVIVFYYGFLKGPLIWVFIMVVATGLDAWGRIWGGITVFHIAWGMSILTVIYANVNLGYKLKWNFPITKYILGFVIWSLISLIYSPNKLSGLQLIGTTVALYFLFVFIANFITTKKDLLIVIWSLLLMNVFNSFLTFYQIAFQNILYFGRGAVESTTGEKIWRASGTFYDPNVLAVFMVVGVIIAIALMIYSDLSRKHKLLLLLSVLISVVGILATFSRSGLVSLFVGILTLMLYHKKKVYLLYTVLAVALLIGFFVLFTPYGGFILERIFSIFDITKDVSIRTRIGLVISSIEMFFDNPVLGIGFRGFPILYPMYVSSITPTALLYVKEAHTLYTLLLAELGIPGFVIVGLWFYQVMKDSLSRLREDVSQFCHSIYVGNVAVFISLLITYIFYASLFPDFNLLWINLGMLYLVKKGGE